jgi:hypothetical protein
MKKLFLAALCGTGLALAACGDRDEVNNVDTALNADEMNMDMNADMNMDMNMDMNATDNATDNVADGNATGNEAIDANTSY